MNVIDIINRKKQGYPLSSEEINYFIKGILSGEIADYQASALLMAMCLKGLDFDETLCLTRAMRDSGEVADFSCFGNLKPDKHSTGGVGDSTTFVVLPILASLGYKSVKMSGRGLGHTGGTLDKLDSISGLTTAINSDKIKEQMEEVGFAIIGQTMDICPADKYLYALRDVTGTVDSIPLISASIMSKKLASGSDLILLDVKCGDGAFMKNFADALTLAETMCAIGRREGKKTLAMITDMNEPLSKCVGNSLEILGAIDALKGEKSRLKDLSVAISANIVSDIESIDYATAFEKVNAVIKDGTAYKKFLDMIKAQGGDIDKIACAKYKTEIKAETDGYVQKIETEALGSFVCELGGGRRKKDDVIDYSVGLKNNVSVVDEVKKGDVLTVVHSNRELTEKEINSVRSFFTLVPYSLDKPRLIYAKINSVGEIILY